MASRALRASFGSSCICKPRCPPFRNTLGSLRAASSIASGTRFFCAKGLISFTAGSPPLRSGYHPAEDRTCHRRLTVGTRFENVFPDRTRGISQTVATLERQHPARILRRKGADLGELRDFVFAKLQLHSGQVVLKLVEPLGSKDHRCNNWSCQQPRQ